MYVDQFCSKIYLPFCWYFGSYYEKFTICIIPFFSMYVNKFIPSPFRFQCLETPYSNVCNAQNILHGVYFENLLHSCLQFTALWCIMRKELIVVITYFIAEKLKCTFVTNSEFRISMTRNLHEIWKKNWTTKRSKIFVICTYTY